jgi:hypothetical protein
MRFDDIFGAQNGPMPKSDNIDNPNNRDKGAWEYCILIKYIIRRPEYSKRDIIFSVSSWSMIVFKTSFSISATRATQNFRQN